MDKKHKASYGLQIPNVEPQRPKSNPSTGTYHKRGLEIEKVPPQPVTPNVIKR
jgi:hypothetical protein